MSGDLIMNAAQLLHHLEAGSHFTVDSKSGQIKTESAAMHALRCIFSGKGALQARNAELRGKMADVLRKTGVPDLTEKFLISVNGADHGKSLLAGGARQAIISDMNEARARVLEKSAELDAAVARDAAMARVKASVIRQARSLPASCRDVAARFVMLKISLAGAAADPAAAKRLSGELFRDIKADKAFQSHLAQGMFDEERMLECAALAAKEAGPSFLYDMSLGKCGSGVHDSLGRDAERGFVSTINGQAPPRDREGAPRMLAELMPDTPGIEPGPANPGWKLRSFVSML
ncbi:MAG: hypothetical protein HUK26_06975, partial [Duodenibacillus sp.]|nr:hypothetical protein [Duodenibacillus sp.]